MGRTRKFGIINSNVEKNIKKLQSVHLHQQSPLQVTVWRVRRLMRDLFGTDVLDTTSKPMPGRQKLRSWYLKLDDLLLKHLPNIKRGTPREVAMKRIRDTLQRDLGYEFYEVDEKRPWGGFYRIVDEQTDKFLADFFPGLSQKEARMGKKGIELSPKIMVWMPGKRLSWQYHYRRAERWHFLTDGSYCHSMKNKLPEPTKAKAGEVVQFAQGERHRGIAPPDHYALVAEIWQHTDPKHASDEADIVRLEDDFQRSKRPNPS